MRSESKRGISTIVATVLIVLITVAAVTLLWAGISPLLDIDISGYDTQLSIVTVGGYTFLDPVNKSVTVQIKSSGGKAADYVQIILTLEDGEELISTHDAPGLNEVSIYYFGSYLASYFLAGNIPVSVSIAPIFIIDGKNVLGLRGQSVKLPIRVEEEGFYDDFEDSDPTGDNTDDGDGGDFTSGDDEEDPDDGPGPGVLFLPVTGCQILDNSTLDYKLLNAIGPFSGTCFTILSDDVTLDMDSHGIVGNGIGTGILNEGYDNFEVRNGSIRSFFRGIELKGTFGNKVVDNVFSNVNVSDNFADGILLDYANNNVFSDMLVMDNKLTGIKLIRSDNNGFNGVNNLLRNGNGVYFSDGSDNNLFNGTSCLYRLSFDFVCDSSSVTNGVSSYYDSTSNCDDSVEFNNFGVCPFVEIFDYNLIPSGAGSNLEVCTENSAGFARELEVDLSGLGWVNGFPFYEEILTSDEYSYLLGGSFYDSVLVCNDGYILISDDDSISCNEIDSMSEPLTEIQYGVIAPYGVKLDSFFDNSGSINYCSRDVGGVKYIVIKWIFTLDDGDYEYEVQAHLYEDGKIVFSYENNATEFALPYKIESSPSIYREIGISRLGYDSHNVEIVTRLESYSDFPFSGDYTFDYIVA